MKATISICLSWMVLTSLAPAQEVKHFARGLIAYEGVVTTPLPTSVKKMTDAEYYEFALRRNKSNIAVAKAKALTPTRRDIHRWSESSSAGASKTRFGGGVGAGGFGGAGGYAGYLNGGGQGGGGGGRGFFYGSGRPGNSMQTNWGAASRTWEAESTWQPFTGGNIEMLNPYVRSDR